jgi:hypothetical protein
MLKMDAYDKSFWAAIHNTDPSRGPCLTLMQRQRAKVFLRRAHANFREILEEVPPAPPLSGEPPEEEPGPPETNRVSWLDIG